MQEYNEQGLMGKKFSLRSTMHKIAANSLLVYTGNFMRSYSCWYKNPIILAGTGLIWLGLPGRLLYYSRVGKKQLHTSQYIKKHPEDFEYKGTYGSFLSKRIINV